MLNLAEPLPVQKPRRGFPNRLASLPAAQRAKLDAWLLQDRLAYVEIQKRLRAEFGVRITLSSLSNYFRAFARKRLRLPKRPRSAFRLEIGFTLKNGDGKAVAGKIFAIPLDGRRIPFMGRPEILRLATQRSN